MISAKPKPTYKIAKAPFYAAWSTPGGSRHARRLAHQRDCQVVDMNGEVIPRLYCGGETTGGFSMHGLARCLCQGYIAGHRAHAEKRRPDQFCGSNEGCRTRIAFACYDGAWLI
jgi:hypothetical protein